MDALDQYPEITPERIALLQLNDCARLLKAWEEYPLRLIQAGKAAHLGFHAALTAALAGSANIGVYRPATREAWLRYFDDREGALEAPTDSYVLPFTDLFEAAKNGHPHGWLTEALVVSGGEDAQVLRLTQMRHWFEHPRPVSHHIEPSWAAAAIPTSARLAVRCLNAVWHHLDPHEQEQVNGDVAEIEALCGEII